MGCGSIFNSGIRTEKCSEEVRGSFTLRIAKIDKNPRKIAAPKAPGYQEAFALEASRKETMDETAWKWYGSFELTGDMVT